MSRAPSTFLEDVRAGLGATPKTLPCKYLYDERGSQLFDAICKLDAYYPTRADLEATRDHVEAIVARVGPRARLVELGSGSSLKTRILLDHLPELAAYIPVDISAEHLEKSVSELERRHPNLEIQPLAGDYTRPLELPEPSHGYEATVVYFPGSTIGNFSPPQAIAFLRRIRGVVAEDDEHRAGGLLIGVDLDKDAAILEAAYDDDEGVTASFNLNLLRRINRELGADFDLRGFRHEARYVARLGRVEMHLVSLRAQVVHVGGEAYRLAAGETIRTEESHKYSREGFARLAAEAGLAVESFWTDRRGLFSLQYLVPR